MHNDKEMNSQTVTTESATQTQQKRSWVAPVLIQEDARYATRGKVSNTGEFIIGGTQEGVAS